MSGADVLSFRRILKRCKHVRGLNSFQIIFDNTGRKNGFAQVCQLSKSIVNLGYKCGYLFILGANFVQKCKSTFLQGWRKCGVNVKFTQILFHFCS